MKTRVGEVSKFTKPRSYVTRAVREKTILIPVRTRSKIHRKKKSFSFVFAQKNIQISGLMNRRCKNVFGFFHAETTETILINLFYE